MVLSMNFLFIQGVLPPSTQWLGNEHLTWTFFLNIYI